MDWDKLVEERNVWIAHNFPVDKAKPGYETTFGVIEELGELTHAHLKQLQSIRGDDAQHVADGQDAVGDMVVYLLGVMNHFNVRPQHITMPVSKDPDKCIFFLAVGVGRLSESLLGEWPIQPPVDRIVYYLQRYCELRDWNFEEIVLNTWNAVKQRDWIAYPDTGLPPEKVTPPNTAAIGWLSAELASRAGAWDGKAPKWFPQPPEWLTLWEEALKQTANSPTEEAAA